MIKKIVSWTIVLLIVLCIPAYFYINSELNETFPDIIKASEDVFIESCKDDKKCTQTVMVLLPICRDRYSIKEVTLFSFHEESSKFFTVVNKCIQDNSSGEVPSVWKYIMEREINE